LLPRRYLKTRSAASNKRIRKWLDKYLEGSGHSEIGKLKKVHPRTGREDPVGDWMYSSTLSLTSALDGADLSTPRPGRFTPGKEPVPIV
jgi:hypothetical protein